MVSRLQKIDPVVPHQVHEPVFLCDASRPHTGTKEAKGLGFPDPFERITYHCLNQLQHLDRRLAIVFDPVLQILPEFGLEDGDTFLWRSATPG